MNSPASSARSISATGFRGERRGISTTNPVTVIMMTPAVNRLNHLRLACSASIRALGFPATDLPDRSALCGHDTRVAAERATTRRHLRQEQHRRHQRTDAVVSGADITPQAHHSLAARQRYYVKAISARTDQRLG